MMCQAACKVGCGCKKGYVRDKKGGECIPKMLCGVVPMKSADEDDDLGYAWVQPKMDCRRVRCEDPLSKYNQ